jgi:hypothetical protein
VLYLPDLHSGCPFAERDAVPVRDASFMHSFGILIKDSVSTLVLKDLLLCITWGKASVKLFIEFITKNHHVCRSLFFVWSAAGSLYVHSVDRRVQGA